MPSTLERLFRHLAWADRRFLEAIDPADPRLEPAAKLMAHIVAAEHIWLGRARSRDLGDFKPWQELSPEECAELADRNAHGFLELAMTTTEPDLEKVIAYRTTRGDAMRTPLGDILLHVALHGAYHRGQIAALLRREDLAAPMTDFVLFGGEHRPSA